MRITVMNKYIDDQEAWAPSTQFLPINLCVTRVKLRVFVQNVAILDPHLTFL